MRLSPQVLALQQVRQEADVILKESSLACYDVAFSMNPTSRSGNADLLLVLKRVALPFFVHSPNPISGFSP